MALAFLSHRACDALQHAIDSLEGFINDNQTQSASFSAELRVLTNLRDALAIEKEQRAPRRLPSSPLPSDEIAGPPSAQDELSRLFVRPSLSHLTQDPLRTLGSSMLHAMMVSPLRWFLSLRLLLGAVANHCRNMIPPPNIFHGQSSCCHAWFVTADTNLTWQKCVLQPGLPSRHRANLSR